MEFKRLCKSILSVLAACLASQQTHAAFHVWTGAVDGYWSNTNNWSSGSAPQVFETPPVEIDFPSGTGRLQTTNDIGFEFLGGPWGLIVDSIIVGDNYTFSGTGYGANIWFSGNPAPFFGINLQNFYIPTPNITVTFDGSLNLYFQATNTITNAASSTLDIQSTLSGAGWTYQGSGQLVFDGGSGGAENSVTGTCTVQAGLVKLNSWYALSSFGGTFFISGNPAVNGPLVIGTTNVLVPAEVDEINPWISGPGVYLSQTAQVGIDTNLTVAPVPVTILPSGTLKNFGVPEVGISSLTMTGGVVYLASMAGNGGTITLPSISSFAPPSGEPSIITSDANAGVNPEGILLDVPNPGGTNSPAIINVASGNLNLYANILEVYSSTNGNNTLLKAGTGTLGFFGTNTYAANTIIQQGVVAAGGDEPFGRYSGGYPNTVAIVSNGAEIIAESPFNSVASLVLNGYGTNGTSGALVVQNLPYGSASFIGASLGSDSAVVTANSTDTATFGTANNLWGTPLAGPANFHKRGPGTLQLSGISATNAISGTTFVEQGTILLNVQTNIYYPNLTLINGPLIIGTNGGVSSATVGLESWEPIAATVPLTIYPGGLLSILGNNQQTVSALTLNGGGVSGGTLVLNADPVVQTMAFYYPEIFSTLSLHGTNRTMNVPFLCSLGLGDIIDGGNGAGVTKSGAGDLNLYGINYCAGPTLVTAGRVGAFASGAFPPMGGGVVVTNAADLLLYDGVNIGAAPLLLAGTGSDGYGPLKSFGTNSWAGTITLASNATVDVMSNASWPGGQLELSGVITGPGGLAKTGWGNLLLDGSSSNNYAGTTLVQQGPLTLSKTNALAIPGPLTIGLGLDGPNGDAVHTLLGYQLSPSNTIAISSSGLLDVSAPYSYVTTIGSLTGSGSVQLGGNGLDCGYDNTSTIYGGSLNGGGGGYLLKYGTGALTLTGSSSFSGILQCESGQLFVNGSMPSAIVSFATGGLLGGTGTVGPFSFTHGTLAPGYNGPGILTSGNVFLNTNDTFLAYITGTLPGTYSELSSTGTVSLNGVHLQLNMPVAGVTNSQLTLINKSTTNAVSGTFFGLPEGSTITAANGAKFTITYHGGAHNNVVLTQISRPAPTAFTGIIKLGGGNVQLDGSGAGNTPYTVWANTNLATTNWITIGTATASSGGQIQFTDTNAPLYQQRFYRFSWP